MIRDALGCEFQFPNPPLRVVSLVPSLTETLFDLGAGDSVVGITDYCTFPSGLDRPRVGGTKNPDVEAVRRLHPDLVHMNLEENLRRHGEAISSFAPVFASHPRSVHDVSDLISTLGGIHHRSLEAASLIEELNQQLTTLPRREFTFLCAIWKSPWMWCGGDTYVSGLVSAAGGHNLLGHINRYPELALEQARLLAPDVIFLPDEPFVFSESDATQVQEETRARVIGPFPGHLFTWHGSRTLLGLRFLHGLVV